MKKSKQSYGKNALTSNDSQQHAQLHVHQNSENISIFTDMFHHNQHNQDRSQINSYARSFFSIKSTINQQALNTWTNKIQKAPFILMVFINNDFFKSFYQYFKNPSPKLYKIIKSGAFNYFVSVIGSKIKFYDKLFNFLHTQLQIKNEIQIQIRQQIIKKLKRSCNYIGQIIQMYKDYKKHPINLKQNVRQQISDVFKSNSDKCILLYLKQHFTSVQLFWQKTSIPLNTFITNKSIFKPASLYKEQIQRMIIHLEKVFIKPLLDTKGSIVESNITQQTKQSAVQFYIPKKLTQKIQQLKQNIQIEDACAANCVNCLTFLYQNLPFSKQKCSSVDIAFVPKVQHIKNKSKAGKIIQFVNGFLNSHKGGTILFDCQPNSFGFIPKGIQMSEKTQQAYKASFMDLLKYVYPLNRRQDSTIQIDFIPLKENLLQLKGQIINQFNKKHVSRSYNGFCVMRVKIKPKSVDQLAYCYFDERPYVFKRRKGNNKELKSEQIYLELKRLQLYFSRLDHKDLEKINKQGGILLYRSMLHGNNHILGSIHEEKCVFIKHYQSKNCSNQSPIFNKIQNKIQKTQHFRRKEMC